MKRYITILLTIASVAACTKSTVTLDQPEPIAIVPVTAHMSKAAVNGTPKNQDLLIWANYATAGTNTQVGDVYFDRALFRGNGYIWTADGYFWPKSGKLTLSGCTALPPGNGTIAYHYADDTTTTDIDEANTITVTDYKQSLNPARTVDFLWFNKTEPADHQNGNLAVEMQHALTWVTIQVQGLGGSIGWNVESIVLKGVEDIGSLTCTIDGAEWINQRSSSNATDITVYQAPKSGTEPYCQLEEQANVIENTQNGTVLIPQVPVDMEVKYHTTDEPSDGTMRSKTLNLAISASDDNNFWEAGKHYVYTVTFNPYQITFAVNTNSWGDTDDNIVDKIVDNYVHKDLPDFDEIDGHDNTPKIENKN